MNVLNYICRKSLAFFMGDLGVDRDIFSMVGGEKTFLMGRWE